MGPYLTVPMKDKDSSDGENARVLQSNDYIINVIAQVRGFRDARMEKYHGGFTYSNSRSRQWRLIFRGV